ncbi:MAG: extracellular solute-binding protein [Treponema sp.]|nr:extracellular solute-binding protein [Treponema sp.]
MKKNVSVILCVILLASFAACKGGGEKGSKKYDQITFKSGWTLAEAAAPWKGETLRFIGESLPPLEALAEVKGEFENITGVKVEIEQYGQAEVNQKTMADFVGKTQIYDMILAPHRQNGTYVQNDWLLPLENFLNDPKLHDPAFDIAGGAMLDDNWWQEVSWHNEKLYGLPFHFIAMYTWYRWDVFDNPIEQAAFKAKYGYDLPSPPVTADEVYDCSEFFTRKKGETLCGETLTDDVYGITLMGKRHVSTWYNILNVLYVFGTREIFAGHGYEYGKIGINSPESVEALEYYKKLSKFCPPGLLSADWDASQAAMQQGLALMGWEWDDAVGAVENPKESMVAGKIAYTGLPIAKEKAVGIEGWNYCIPKLSKKPELAWLFLQWAMGTMVQKQQMAFGGESGVAAVYDDPEVQQKPYVPTAVYLKTGGNKIIGIRKVGDQSGWGVPEAYANAINPKTGTTEVSQISKPTFPEQQEIVDAILLAASKILSDEMAVKPALDECAATFEKILAGKQ